MDRVEPLGRDGKVGSFTCLFGFGWEGRGAGERGKGQRRGAVQSPGEFPAFHVCMGEVKKGTCSATVAEAQYFFESINQI